MKRVAFPALIVAALAGCGYFIFLNLPGENPLDRPFSLETLSEDDTAIEHYGWDVGQPRAIHRRLHDICYDLRYMEFLASFAPPPTYREILDMAQRHEDVIKYCTPVEITGIGYRQWGPQGDSVDVWMNFKVTNLTDQPIKRLEFYVTAYENPNNYLQSMAFNCHDLLVGESCTPNDTSYYTATVHESSHHALSFTPKYYTAMKFVTFWNGETASEYWLYENDRVEFLLDGMAVHETIYQPLR